MFPWDHGNCLRTFPGGTAPWHIPPLACSYPEYPLESTGTASEAGKGSSRTGERASLGILSLPCCTAPGSTDRQQKVHPRAEIPCHWLGV